jgi:MFS family permease
LLRFYSASNERVGYFFIPIALANFLGPLLFGRFFDTVGRRVMIAATYCLSGFVLFASSALFLRGWLGTIEQVALWAPAFLFASTAASSAYLTVSEVFPQQIRATAIATFYAVGTLACGVSGPFLFGHLVGSAQRVPLFAGYSIGAAVMIAAGIAQWVWGVDAEGKSLESLVIP